VCQEEGRVHKQRRQHKKKRQPRGANQPKKRRKGKSIRPGESHTSIEGVGLGTKLKCRERKKRRTQGKLENEHGAGLAQKRGVKAETYSLLLKLVQGRAGEKEPVTNPKAVSDFYQACATKWRSSGKKNKNSH